MFIKTRFTRDKLGYECLVGDRFKFTQTANGVPHYFLDRLCEVKEITLDKEVIFFFYCETLRDRKISLKHSISVAKNTYNTLDNFSSDCRYVFHLQSHLCTN